jgi:hypothetical protein
VHGRCDDDEFTLDSAEEDEEAAVERKRGTTGEAAVE